MPFEIDAPRRLHPASVLFNLAREVKAFALPALLLIFGAGSRDEAWRLWGALLLVPAAAAAVARYLTFTYRYAPGELIVRSGLFFKRERHIPYTRIQNIDATQNIVHSMFGVFTVTLETGSGAEAEGTFSVLPEAALVEMRQRVFESRTALDATRADAGAAEVVPETAVPGPAPDVLLKLGLRDLALCGLVRGRGLLLLAAIVGTLFQFGDETGLIDERTIDPESPGASGPIERALSWLVSGGAARDLIPIAVIILLFVILILALRILSMIYTMQRLYGFTLSLTDGELRMEYGLLTRVRATIPLRRLQAVTIREGPLHRLFGVCSVRADTAGGAANREAAGSREWLAPIIARKDAARFVRTLVPEVNLEAGDWQPPHPRALRRMLVKPSVLAVAISAALAWRIGVWALLVLALLLIASAAHARVRARRMAHRADEHVFMFRSGAFWRHVTIAPLRKVQAVALGESPFDRRHGMASLVVDTAGASGAPHRLDVPYLGRTHAAELAAVIGGRAGQSALRW